MQDTAQAIDALGSFDVDVTKEALVWLADHGEITALEHVLPLSAHPDVAIRWFAKKALRALRERARAQVRPRPPVRGGGEEGQEERHEQRVAAAAAAAAARLEAVRSPGVGTGAPLRHRTLPNRPDFFKVDVVI